MHAFFKLYGQLFVYIFSIQNFDLIQSGKGWCQEKKGSSSLHVIWEGGSEKFAQRTSCIAFVSSTLSSEMLPRFSWHSAKKDF